MKLSKKDLSELITKVVGSYTILAEEGNPFVKGGGEEEKKEEPKEKAPEKPAGIPVKFDVSAVKRYNKALFKSDNGVVKSLDKKGVVVTVQPDGVDVLVNFNDLLEVKNKRIKR